MLNNSINCVEVNISQHSRKERLQRYLLTPQTLVSKKTNGIILLRKKTILV